MDLKEIRSRCETWLSTLTVPAPFDLDRFVGMVAERRGRPIHLHAATVTGAPCGVWFSADDADHVFYDGTTSPVHRQHIVLHELGHVVAQHRGSSDTSIDWIRRLMPNLDPDVISRVLCRSTYLDVEEVEAEVFASVVLERAGGRSPSAPVVLEDEVMRRIRLALADSGR
jgi:hypothetical protein